MTIRNGSMIVQYDDGERMRDGTVQPTEPPCWMVTWAALPEGMTEDPSHLQEFPDLVKALAYAAKRVDNILVSYQGTEFYASGSARR